MSPSKIYEPHDVVTTIAYWQERSDGSLPVVDDAMKIMRQGKEADAREAIVHDIRNNINDFTLDRNGFQVWTLPEIPAYTKDDKEIEEREFPQVIDYLKKITGGTHVHIFSHVVRDNLDTASEEEKLNPQAFGKQGPRSPAIRPHADFNIATIAEFFSSDNPDLATHIASGKRWQVLGLWRPLKTVRRSPLGFCDARTVSEEDYVALPRLYGAKRGANSVMKAGDGGHRWYWLSEQGPDEAWVFKHFDSHPEEGEGRQCAHTSFELEGTGDLPPRESVEFRALVFY